eukprot:TRINITY_DN2958_c0_g1_i3.p1 TRINITY_DN2958_c0_g1~~TRINITY_DN2958_c0_g1_i3.p1  ORF type:complete len:1225 (-),score=367.75 TRINITY_DN2958_c0_g1_i3:22-3696(-)
MGHGDSKLRRPSSGINVEDIVELDPQTINLLQEETQGRFTFQEIKLLYFVFNEYFPEILLGKLNGLGEAFVKYVVLKVIDPQNEGLTFTQLLRLMSVVSRGTEEEHRRLVFAIFDSEKSGSIKLEGVERILSNLSWDVKKVFFKEYPDWNKPDIQTYNLDTEDNVSVSETESMNEMETRSLSTSSSFTDISELHPDLLENPARFNSPTRAIKNSRAFRYLFDRKHAENHGGPSPVHSILKKKERKTSKLETPIEDETKHTRAFERFLQWSKDVENKLTNFRSLGPKSSSPSIDNLDKSMTELENAPSPVPPASPGRLLNVLSPKRRTKEAILSEFVKTFFGEFNSLTYVDYEERIKMSPPFHFMGSGCGIMRYFKDALFVDLEKRVTVDLLTPPSIEGWLMKGKALSSTASTYRKRFCVLKSGVLFMFKDQPAPNKETKRPKVIPLVFCYVRAVDEGHPEGQYCFYLSAKNGEYKSWFLAKSKKRRTGWIYAITANTHEIPDHRFQSFVPERKNIACRWFVDGRELYRFMADTINSAVSEIFIAGWWVSPELYLKREFGAGLEWRLDMLLRKKAEQGIKIYVLVWNETKVAMTLNSYHTKTTLEKLHSNIKVLTHPPSTPIYWSHHQKIVVVDQDVSFVGGLDLCFGRWDSPEHSMIDNCHLNTTWPGKDYFNEGRKAFTNVNEPFVDGIDRMRIPRLPWHDVHACCDGAAARDVGRNFIMRWNHHVVAQNSSYSHLYPKTTPPNLTLVEDGILVETNAIPSSPEKASRHNLTGSGLLEPTRMQLNLFNNSSAMMNGKRESQFGDSDELHSYAEKGIVQKTDSKIIVPVCPALNFVQLAMAIKKDTPSNALSPLSWRVRYRASSSINQSQSGLTQSKMDARGFSKNCQVQVLRSLGSWSGSITTETSVQRAYLEIILNAQHFIYIENQYFISSLAGGGIQNKIAEALYSRIRRAVVDNEVFRVIVLLPAFPTGNGTWKDSPSAQYVMKWQYQTINRGGNSIFEKLTAEFPDIKIEDYITFHSIRTRAYLQRRLVTEQIYVHCKCIIVDDRVAIIGSANINDRSMNGERDSEICLLIEDGEMIESSMNGQPYLVSGFAHELRKNLWREHLGLDDSDDTIKDPVHADIYHGIWLKTAKQNTQIYSELFKNIPQDGIETLGRFLELERFGRKFWKRVQRGDNQPDMESALQMIKGHLVMFPLKFLNRESLAPSFRAFENWMSAEVFQ